MGLCASKSDSQAVSSSSNVTKRTTSTGPQKHKPNTPAKSVQPPTFKRSNGNKILEDAKDANRGKISATEAAKLAAEKRFQEANEKSTRGELGKKLAEERSKSHKSQMMKQVEQQKLENANGKLVYD